MGIYLITMPPDNYFQQEPSEVTAIFFRKNGERDSRPIDEMTSVNHAGSEDQLVAVFFYLYFLGSNLNSSSALSRCTHGKATSKLRPGAIRITASSLGG